MYVINKKDVFKDKVGSLISVIISFIFFAILINDINSVIRMNADKSIFDIFVMICFNFTNLAILGIGILIFYMGIRGLKLAKIKKEKYEVLEKTGRLEKNVPCYVEEIKVRRENRRYVYRYRVVVDYVLPNNITTKLQHYKVYLSPDDVPSTSIDVLIDPLDYDNYYIDFDIQEKD